MTDEEYLKETIARGAMADKGYFQFAHVVAVLLPKNLREQLEQLINGPVWDGDVIGKSHRDRLLGLGLAVRVCYKGEQGYTGATYFAFVVARAIRDIESGKLGA